MRGPAALLALLAALALPALGIAGCGLGAGAAPRSVSLLLTRDFGARSLLASGAPRVAGQETVMRLLMRNATVATRYSGGFVQSIDGLAGGEERGRPVDWFYYVNGVEANRGAAATDVHPGDHIWWDRHDWSQSEDVPAVVGSFPEPFLNGVEGRRLPVRIECEAIAGAACRAVDAQLRALGVPAFLAGPSSSAGPGTLRVLVGVWSRVGADPVARLIGAGPRSSGVYATFSAGGRALVPLNGDGAPSPPLGAGTGLVGATRRGEEPPVWVVTGTDAAGVARAARAFRAAALQRRFAVAVTSAGATIALPVGG